jgi:hypothetical protein
VTVARTLRSSRWRRAFIAACLPYLFLSVFVDSLHADPPWIGGGAPIGAYAGIAPDADAAPLPAAPCVICQWLRTGTGLHVPLTLWPTDVPLHSAVALAPTAKPDRPAPLSPDFCGPPLPVLG